MRWVVLVVAVLLIGARLALPYVLRSYVNRQLNRNAEFAGSIGRVTVHLWRGAYRINSIDIHKSNGAVPVPLFAAKAMDLSVQWKELFHGAVVGRIRLEQPELNFVGASDPEQRQTGKDKPWGEMLESLFPFRINQFEIQDGSARFRNFGTPAPVNVYLTNLFAVATNLTNSRDVKEKLPAGLRANAQTLGGGGVAVDLKMNPLATAPTFELNAALTNVDMVALNDFFRSYGKFDVERGTFSMFTTTASVDGKYEGTIKVLFENLDVFAWEKERKKNILEIFWEGVVGTLAAGFKNHAHDRLATNIPISGSFTNSHVGMWSAAGSLLHNAFIKALLPKIDQPKTVEDVEKKEKERER